MKVRITFKDPDGPDDAIEEAFDNADDLPKDEEEREAVVEMRVEKLREALTDKWLPYGEYVTLEYDTEADTMRVVPKRESGL